MRIGELSRRAGVSRDTIRFYEKRGLIQSRPSRHTSNNYREYGGDVIITLDIIKEAQAAGFTIAELSKFLKELQASEKGGLDGEAFLDAKISEVELNIQRSKRFLKTLKDAKLALAMPQEIQ